MKLKMNPKWAKNARKMATVNDPNTQIIHKRVCKLMLVIATLQVLSILYLSLTRQGQGKRGFAVLVLGILGEN